MRLIADINIPHSVIVSLIKNGHKVIDLKKDGLKMKDVEIIELAKKERCIILTRDKDFLILTQYPKYQVPAIVVRLKNQKPQYLINKLTELIENQDMKVLSKSLTIIYDDTAKSYPY